MILTDEEVTAIRKALPAVCHHQDVIRAIEAAILAKIGEPVQFYTCQGCDHMYLERVTSCDCMTDLGITPEKLYRLPEVKK